MAKRYFVYILASKPYGILYIGMTCDLIRRTYEHKQGVVAGFTKKYHVKKLVYYEEYQDAENAVLREKRMKEWKRSMKIDLIEQYNPNWSDLYEAIAVA